MSSPVGLVIGGNKASNQWKIGKEIGSGACASVHLLIGPDGKLSEYVVKVTPLPTKITKQKKSPPERNARLLYHEALLYQNTFPEYQGDILPALPGSGGPPATGDENGFRFLTMEKMASPLFDVIPSLLRSASTSIDLGPIAQRLLTCVETLHNEDHIVIDIKPENFMLAKGPHKKATKGKKSTEETLADRIRALDIALAAPLKGVGGAHRLDEGGDVVGTPLYCSRNVHENHTPSRRDDIEALLILVCELIIRCVAEMNGESSKYEGSGTKIASFLPWSHGKSDSKIGELKAAALKNINSEFYKRMGDSKTAKLMHSLFETTANMKYKAKPDYTNIFDSFGKLQVELPRKKKAAPKQSRTTRSKRAADTATKETDSNSPKKHTKVAREGQEELQDMETDTEEFHDANEVEDMDWENLPGGKTDSKVGLTITIVEGPDVGHNLDLTVGGTETVIVGKNPANLKNCGALWQLKDNDAGDVHAQLELRASKICSVTVKDMKAEGGVLIGNKRLTRGKDAQLFINDKFQVGNTVFSVKALSDANKKPKATKSKVPTTKKKPLTEAEISEGSTNAATDITLKVMKGPHEGESFSFALGQSQIINLGSTESSAKGGESIVLDADSSIEKLHARFELQGSKKMLTVAVTDLSKSGSLEVNGKKIAKGRVHVAFMNDQVTLSDNTSLEILRG